MSAPTRPHPDRVPASSEGQEDHSAALDDFLTNMVKPAPGLDYLLPGDKRGESWGYTEERWKGSFLVLDGDRVICSLLHASQEGKGYVKTLFEGIEASGYRVSVPVPMARMMEILKKQGFVPHTERNDDGDPADVWEKPR